MGSLVLFDGSFKVPAYAKIKKPSADLTQGVMGGFPVLSIKGKVWAIVRDGTRKIITKPGEPDEPATGIEVVVLKANPALSKVYYAKGFEEGANEKPTCYSNNGVKPEADAAEAQSKTCAACPHNVWGSGTQGKGKACQDSRRVAVAAAGNLSDPMLLRVPPASLRVMKEFGDFCAGHGVEYNTVVVRMRFDPAEATPKLVIQPKGLLPEESARKAMEMAAGDLVAQICGLAPAPTDAEPAGEVGIPLKEVAVATGLAGDDEPAPKAKAPRAKPGPKPAPKPAPAADEDEDGEIPAPAAAKPAPKPAPADDDSGDDLDSLLSTYDD